MLTVDQQMMVPVCLVTLQHNVAGKFLLAPGRNELAPI